MAQIGAALPEGCRPHVIIVGSLAAGYHFFSGAGQRSTRTKDVDCMFSPHAKAVAAAGTVTELLLGAKWQQHKEGEWAEPGNAETPDDKLPMIRLKPPGPEGGSDWFLELLGVPDTNSQQDKTFHRVQTSLGTLRRLQLQLPRAGRVEAHRDEVRPARGSTRNDGAGQVAPSPASPRGPHQGHGDQALQQGSLSRRRVGMVDCRTRPAQRHQRARGMAQPDGRRAAPILSGSRTATRAFAGAGLRELMSIEGDRGEALSICNKGLLASMEVGRDAFPATGRRVIQQGVEPLADAALD